MNVTASKTPADLGFDFITELLSHMGIDARVDASDGADGTVVIRLEGETTALRANKELQAAIAQLAGQALSQATDSRVRVALDLDGDRGAREQFLGDLASEVAEIVAETGRRAVIEGLDSPERRIVHTALMDHGGVNTHSEGGDANRYLLVEPAP